MTTAGNAYQALQFAMRVADPLCQDDPRFIDDYTEADEIVDVCAACPIFEACADYARIARPQAGIWAGKRRGAVARKPKGKTA